MCTDDDDYAQLGLSSPVFLDGRLLTPREADEVFDRMEAAFETLNPMAKDVDAYQPWQSRDAAALDEARAPKWNASEAGSRSVT